MKYYILLLISGLLVWSCHGQKGLLQKDEDTNELIDINTIKINMNFLASDELQGRETGTNSELVASLFIASELEKYGVQPFFGADGYFQNIKLRQILFSDQSGFTLVENNQKKIKDYQYGTDFVCTSGYYPSFDTTAALVFAGYGITAEEYGYDDYRDIDVQGKIVLLLGGEPESDDSTYFDGKKLTHYAIPTNKLANAVEHGAIGFMRSSVWEARYGWESIINYVKKGKYILGNQKIENRAGQIPEIVISDSTLKNLLGYGDKSYSEIQEGLREGKPMPVFELPLQAQVNWQFDTTRTVNARNVLGVIEGNDPLLKKEYVGLGAHFDHEGVGPEGVYNGADDDASGTVALLGVAKAFAKIRNNRRSIFIAFHTGEEKGLLGSKYLTSETTVIDSMIAHINMDMVGCGSADSIYSIGSDKLSHEFRQLVESVNTNSVKMNLNYRFDDPGDTQRFYYRSDHYNYAKRNIPIVFFFDYQMDNYHRVTDDVDKINFRKIQKIARLSFEIARAAANRENRFILDEGNEQPEPAEMTN